MRHRVHERAVVLTWFTMAVGISVSLGADSQSMTSWQFANGRTQAWHASKSWQLLGSDDQCWRLEADSSMDAQIRRSGLVLLGPVIDPPQEVHIGDGIELLLRSSHSGVITLYFQEQIGDTIAEFGQERAERRYLHSSVDYQVLHIRPRWNDASKIVRLRLDGPMRGGVLEIKVIRFVRSAANSDTGSAPEWDFRQQAVCRRVIGELPPESLQITPDGLTIAVQDGPGRVTLDDRTVNAESNPWVRFRMRTNAGPLGGFAFHPTNRGGDAAMRHYWATHEFVKWFQFPVRPDGDWHTYNIRLTDYDFPAIGDAAHRKTIRSGFRGEQRVFHLVPSHHPNAKSCIESISFGPKPTGPACLVAEYFGSADAVIRSGRTGTLAIRLRNVGGAPATGLRVEPSKDHDSTRFHVSSIRHIPESLKPDQTTTLLLDGRAERAGIFQVNLAICCDSNCGDQDRLELSTDLHVEPAIHFKSGEIPEPNPIRTPYSIGCYYFTGWSDLNHWPKLLPLAERRPALGFYDECTPEVADWDIKWAVEHGIDHFVVLWYDHNGQQRTRFIEDALLKAKFLPHIDFCVMWCNAQNPWWNWTEDDFVRITNYWIRNYFVHPQYKRDTVGRPIVWMLQGWNMLRHFGKKNAIRLMQDAEARARKAGFPGIHWIACQHGGRHMFEDPADLTAAGFEEWTAYNINGHISYPLPVIPAADVVKHAPAIWKACQAKTVLPVFCGWDSRWVGREFTSCYGFSPALFARHLADAKLLLDQGAAEGLVVDCWNEWGEGEILAPHAEHGFRLLEQIPKVFAPREPTRPAVVPEDVGLAVPQIHGLRDPARE